MFAILVALFGKGEFCRCFLTRCKRGMQHDLMSLAGAYKVTISPLQGSSGGRDSDDAFAITLGT